MPALSKRQELILDKLSALQAKVASIASKMGVTLEGAVHAVTSQLTGGCYLALESTLRVFRVDFLVSAHRNYKINFLVKKKATFQM